MIDRATFGRAVLKAVGRSEVSGRVETYVGDGHPHIETSGGSIRVSVRRAPNDNPRLWRFGASYRPTKGKASYDVLTDICDLVVAEIGKVDTDFVHARSLNEVSELLGVRASLELFASGDFDKGTLTMVHYPASNPWVDAV